jgi:hypothetical protein
MNTTITECEILDKLQGTLLAIGVDEETDESNNEDERQEIQFQMSQHFMNCTHLDCIKSFKARVEVGIQTTDGVYLK